MLPTERKQCLTDFVIFLVLKLQHSNSVLMWIHEMATCFYSDLLLTTTFLCPRLTFCDYA